MAKTAKNEKLGEVMAEQQYSKQQLITSKKYAHRRDLIGALLVDGKTYPIGEVDTLIEKYNERKI